MDVTNAHDHSTSSSYIFRDINSFTQKLSVEYTSFIEGQHHALVRLKQEVSFLEASLAKQKANMIANKKASNPVLQKFRKSAKN